VDVHQGERYHAVGSWAWVELGRGLAGREAKGTDREPIFC
jgi:hypothetical protein